VSSNRIGIQCWNRDVVNARVVPRYRMLARNSLSHLRLIDQLASSDIIQLRIEVSLRDRLHGCGLQGLG
jgi:hypothetical protein